MIKKTLIHCCSFSLDYSIEKPRLKGRNSIYSFNPRTSTCLHKNKSSLTKSISKQQKPSSVKNISISNKSSMDNSFETFYLIKQKNPLLITNKAKLSNFTSFVNEIYNIKDNSSIKAKDSPIRPSKVHKKNPQSINYPFIQGINKKQKLKSKSVNVSREALTKALNKRNSLSQIIKVNLHKSELPEFYKVRRDTKNISLKNSILNFFLLKVIDKEAILEDYTKDKGNINLFYSRLKLQMRKESTRINGLINNIKKANVMNEKWLKYYNVKLRNKESKFYQMPNEKPELF